MLTTLLAVAAVFAVVFAVVAAPGALITWGRRRSTARAMIEYSDTKPEGIGSWEPLPEGAIDDVEEYVLRVTPAYRQAADNIQAALDAFLAGPKGKGVVIPPVQPASTVEIALARLLAGVRESFTAAVDRVEADTAQWSAAALRELFAAEDAAALV